MLSFVDAVLIVISVAATALACLIARHNWVATQRTLIYENNYNLPIQHPPLQDYAPYHVMMNKFWVFDIEKFRINKYPSRCPVVDRDSEVEDTH